jgi:hypothetical protein
MSDEGICALCQQKSELRLSHIVPSFFGTYLKETSATGYLRGAGAPNLRVQDLVKRRLLCDRCEGRFAVWEGQFKEKAFKAVQNDGFRELEYGDWLLLFLVSVSWRVLISEVADGLVRRNPQFSKAIEAARESWRLFLLGERKQPRSEHHLFIFAGLPQSVPADYHPKSLDYIYRAVDATSGFAKRVLFIYTKALRSMFFSPIVPSSPGGWTNTRVHAGFGRMVSPQKIAMPGFGGFINSRVAACFGHSLSDKQIAKIADVMVTNPDRALASESYKVHLAGRSLINKKY